MKCIEVGCEQKAEITVDKRSPTRLRYASRNDNNESGQYVHSSMVLNGKCRNHNSDRFGNERKLLKCHCCGDKFYGKPDTYGLGANMSQYHGYCDDCKKWDDERWNAKEVYQKVEVL